MKKYVWNGHPIIKAVKLVYDNLRTLWDNLDEKEYMYIYDDKFIQIAEYNGKAYTALDGKELKLDKEMSFSHNPFHKKMTMYEPLLFKVPEKGSKYDTYSRICAWNVRRQPVILTEEEKRESIKSHQILMMILLGTVPILLPKVILHLSKYWDFKRRIPLKEIPEGEEDKVIPQEVKPCEFE